MLTLLKNLDCYVPGHTGKNDILICGDKIYRIQPRIKYTGQGLIEHVLDCGGLCAFPGLIDQHVHITGGGGEDGFLSHIPEIDIQDILSAGVTTLVGLLGADSCTRSLESLYAKAKALEEQGITTYIYSGCYSVPPLTFTGDIVRDMVLIDKVIGIGELALSDHRASHASPEELLKIASDTHLGGLLGKKAGVVHLHFGDGKKGLSPLLHMLENSDLPVRQFVPTHLNRNPELFKQAVEYCKFGGNIDLTAGETEGIAVADAVGRLACSVTGLSSVTISSDSNGSAPDGTAGRIQAIYEDTVRCITERKIPPHTAFSLVTENVAKLLKIYPKKGALLEGSDADLLITDREYHIKKVFCGGRLLFDC